MSSNDPTKNIFPADVRVKIEPGTSASSTSLTSSETSSTHSERLPYIKSEPSVQPAPTQRLTSFRLPRDLTLGGNIKVEKPKKVYAPNVNVQRNKKKNESTPSKIKHEPVKQINSRGRGRGRGDRGRGDRGRGRANIIESAGIWSEGIYSSPVNKKYSNHSNSDTKMVKYIEKPKLNLKEVIGNAEEDEKLKKFLADDYADDYEDDDERLKPLSLPRINQNSYKIKEKDKISVEHKPSDMSDRKKAYTISEMTENKSNSYVLIQFPDCFPNVESSREETEQSRLGNSNGDKDNDNATATNCALNSLKDGFLGKLEILKSGNARLRLGDAYFHVDLGVQEAFRQDLVAVKLDTESSTGDSINLGPVNGKLICSPDLNRIFSDIEDFHL